MEPRRHRLLTVPSSLVLLVCLFLPAIDSCGEPVYPVTMPMAWPPHLLAVIVLVLIAAEWRRRGHPRPAARWVALVLAASATVAVAWYGLWLDASMLVGLPLAMAAAGWLAVGALIWWRELVRAAPLPSAHIAHRDRSRFLVPLLAALMFGTFALIVARVPFARAHPADDPIELDLSGLYGC